MRPFTNPAVAAVFQGYPRPVRTRLARLRELIFETAAKTDGVGRLEETLKWGQPSYLTPQTKSGSTVRIDAARDGSARCAIYFHCQTRLVETFRGLYSDTLRFEGNRAIVFEAGDDIPAPVVRHCVAMALTYHLNKTRKAAGAC